MITLSRKASNYSADDKVEVAGGRFRSQKFSQKGSDLNPGRYSVEVLMPFPGVQSAGVRSVIGERGEELTGPLVKHEELGNLVKYVSTFQVGKRPTRRRTRRRGRRKRRTTRNGFGTRATGF